MWRTTANFEGILADLLMPNNNSQLREAKRACIFTKKTPGAEPGASPFIGDVGAYSTNLK
jgi:hypothetical protein